jgi:putative phosphoribosyl transferase
MKRKGSIECSIPVDGQTIQGNLIVPIAAEGSVIFAHGSGSSRHSPRNRYVADILNRAGLATLLMDLLTPDEERIDDETLEHRFDIDLLGHRLVAATDWLLQQRHLSRLPVGYFGSSTGAAAALVAATERPSIVKAIVSRGGRPDLAGEALTRVTTPTLFIVGELDSEVMVLNQNASNAIQAYSETAIVPHATHLFEEPGALDHVAQLASLWFTQTLMRRYAA